MHKTAICVIIKDELDLDEWIIYHQEIGFDHIYIYDNNEISISEEIKKHKNCTYIHFPGPVKQIEAYEDWIKNFKSECEYVCVIDADEYVVFSSKYKSIRDVLSQLPEDHDALILNSKLFFNLEKTRKKGLLFLNNLTWQKFWYRKNWKSKPILINYSKSVKTFSKTELIKEINNPHTIEYFTDEVKSYSGDLKSKCVVKNFCHYMVKEPEIWINHYYIKSLKEFRHKCLVRGRATTEKKRNFEKELNGQTVRYNPELISSNEPTEIVLLGKKVQGKLNEIIKQTNN